jgi:hypothetical protein
MLWILGGLIAAYSTCNGVSAIVLSPEMIAKNPFLANQAEMPFEPETIKLVAIIFNAVVFAFGITLLVLGLPVRNGSATATTIAIVIVALALVPVVLMMAISLIASLVAPLLLIVAAMMAIPLVLLGLLMVWLVQAARSAQRTASMQVYAAPWMAPTAPPYMPATGGYGYGQSPIAPTRTMPPGNPPDASTGAPDA